MTHEPTYEEQELAELRRLFADLQEDGCPCDDETLVTLVVGELDDEERERLADRIVLSREASERYRTLAALHQGASAMATIGPRARRLRMMSAAAAVLLVIAAAVLWRVTSHGPVGPAGDTLRSPLDAVVRPVDGAGLVLPPTELEWSPQIAASGYRVRLFDAEAQLLWSSDEVSEPRLQLPEVVVATVASGGSYMWTVDVEGAVQRRRLGPYWFTVEPSTARQ
jgi:hypothetical protein